MKLLKFKEFDSWCNARACDGCWGLIEALTCIDIIEKVRKEPFWRREKIWKSKYEDDVVEQIIKPIEEMIAKIKIDI